MLLLELAIQAVRGCSPTARAAFKPGYNLVKGPQASPPPLAGLLTAVCYPDGRATDAAFLAAGQKVGRAGVSLQGDDGTTWRLVKELGGQGSLHRLDPQTRKFEVVSQDAQEIGTALRTKAGLLPRASYEALFTLTASQLPSRQPIRGGGGGGAKAEAPTLRRENVPDVDPTDAEARVRQLEAELKNAKEIAAVQFQQDALTNELYNVEAKFNRIAEAKTKLDEARAAYEAAPTPEKFNLPKDIVERVKRHPAEIKRRDDALKKLFEEREQANALDHGPLVAPIWKDRAFLGALAAGAVLTVAGAQFEGGLRYLALAAVVGWSFAGLRMLSWLNDKQSARKDTGIKDIFATREKKILDEFSLVHSIVDAAYTALQVDGVEDFVAAMGKKQQLHDQLGELEVAYAELQVDPEFAEAERKAQAVKAELEQVQTQLAGMTGGYFRSPTEIERDMELFRAAARKARGLPTGLSNPSLPVISDGPSGALEDPSPAFLLLAGGVVDTDVPGAALVVKDRLAQYLAALSDKRWTAVEYDSDGRATLIGQGKRVRAADVDAKDLDLYYLCLKLTFIEKSAVRAKAPVVLEDVFGECVDAARFPLLGRMLKHLGTVAQVLHVTGAGQNAFQADHTVSV